MHELETMYWTVDGKIATLTLNRTRYLNAIGNQGTIDLNTAADAIGQEPDVRVVIIKGAGRAFCTGIDLKELSRQDIDMTYHYRWEPALRKWETMDKIVIVGMHGYCLGGALQLALACDIRVSTPDCQIGLPAIRECLIPGLAPLRLPYYVGLGRAKQLIISGDNIDGREAHRIGLVDHLVEADRFEEGLQELAQKYVKAASVGAIQSKRLTNLAFDLDFESFLQEYYRRQDVAMHSDDFYEAIAAYREDREPVWK